nr:MAG TPA: hypothetical protein [Caudoviricetes sp.]
MYQSPFYLLKASLNYTFSINRPNEKVNRKSK